MTDPAAARSFLVGEVDALEPLGFVAVVPAGRLEHAVEVARTEDAGLEVRVPGRPPASALEASVRADLSEKGFASEDADDSGQPWTCAVSGSEDGVALAQKVLIETFGEKPDAVLDIGHGSHRLEHEARGKLAIARSRIEQIVTEMLGKEPERDADGDYVLPIGEVHVIVAPRASMDAQVVIRVFSITNVGVTVTPELGIMLAQLNFGLMFGRFALDVAHQSIWFDETLLGEEFREEELRFAIRTVASTADGWDDQLKQRFGGSTYEEVLMGRSNATPPPTKPGQGSLGFYL